MVTFQHKKMAMETIQQKIQDEIRRKKEIMEMGESLQHAKEQLDLLDDDYCALFNNRDENKERNSKPAMIRNYEMTHKIDPYKADLLIQSKAISYVAQWSFEKLPEHHRTIQKWKDIWQINQNFEQNIMDDEKGYRIENRDLKVAYNTKIQALVDKFHVVLESQELAINDLKLRYMDKINQLEMQIADAESLKMRENESL